MCKASFRNRGKIMQTLVTYFKTKIIIVDVPNNAIVGGVPAKIKI